MIIELNKNNIHIIEHSFINKNVVENELENNPYAKYYVYVDDNQINGYLYYSEIYDRIEINQIEVFYKKRNQGIATKLMKKLTETVEKDITLEVKIDNDIAIKLYKSFGFKKVAIRKGYYKGIDGILMERKTKDS